MASFWSGRYTAKINPADFPDIEVYEAWACASPVMSVGSREHQDRLAVQWHTSVCAGGHSCGTKLPDPLSLRLMRLRAKA